MYPSITISMLKVLSMLDFFSLQCEPNLSPKLLITSTVRSMSPCFQDAYLVPITLSILQAISPQSFFNYVIKIVESITNFIIIDVELLYDSGANYFIVNDPKLLPNLILCANAVGVTGGSTSMVSFKGTLCLLLQGDQSNLVFEVKNVPCVVSDPHNAPPPFFTILRLLFQGGDI